MDPKALVVVLALVVAWLAPVVFAFRKRRWWAGTAGLVAPFFYVFSFARTLFVGFGCHEDDASCARDSEIGAILVILVFLALEVWVVVAAVLPRRVAQEPSQVDTPSTDHP